MANIQRKNRATFRSGKSPDARTSAANVSKPVTFSHVIFQSLDNSWSQSCIKGASTKLWDSEKIRMTVANVFMKVTVIVPIMLPQCLKRTLINMRVISSYNLLKLRMGIIMKIKKIGPFFKTILIVPWWKRGSGVD